MAGKIFSYTDIASTDKFRGQKAMSGAEKA